MFIVFEGIDRAGKSTQARALLRRLQSARRRTRGIREPGGTPLGETIRRWVKTQPGLSPLDELFLFSAARSHLVEKVIRPELAEGKIVVADRFSASTVAYQGYGRGLDFNLIEQVNREATAGLAPDLTILLDLSPETAALRGDPESAAPMDNFDSAPLEFQQRVRKGYWAQAEREPSCWLVLAGSLSVRQLSREIWTRVEPLL